MVAALRRRPVWGETEAKRLEQQLQRMLWPNLDHEPPCRIPWATSIEPVAKGPDTESLQEQVGAEGDPPA